MLRTWHSHYCGPGSIPDQGTRSASDQWQEIVIINFKNNIVKSLNILVLTHMVYTFIYSLYIFIYSFLTLT